MYFIFNTFSFSNNNIETIYYPVMKEVKIAAATMIKLLFIILFKTRDIFYKAGQGSSNILRKIIYCQEEKNKSILQQGLINNMLLA